MQMIEKFLARQRKDPEREPFRPRRRLAANDAPIRRRPDIGDGLELEGYSDEARALFALRTYGGG